MAVFVTPNFVFDILAAPESKTQSPQSGRATAENSLRLAKLPSILQARGGLNKAINPARRLPRAYNVLLRANGGFFAKYLSIPLTSASTSRAW